MSSKRCAVVPLVPQNGTFVNDFAEEARIDRVELKDGDDIRLGGVEVAVMPNNLSSQGPLTCKSPGPFSDCTAPDCLQECLASNRDLIPFRESHL